jgi:hypothetical protein
MGFSTVIKGSGLRILNAVLENIAHWGASHGRLKRLHPTLTGVMAVQRKNH